MIHKDVLLSESPLRILDFYLWFYLDDQIQNDI